LSAALAAALGIDAQAIRVHDGGEAAAAADAAGAEAYAVGADMVFAAGRYRPDSADGRRLIAHEAAHVAQAQAGAVPPGTMLQQKRRGGSGGLGAAPPSAPFTTGEGKAPEDRHVLFPRDKAALDSADRATLRALAEAQTEPAKVDVYGYASGEGDPDYNLNLSAHRAVAVADYLRSRLPAGSEVTAHAHGETGGFDTTPDNRRVGVDVEPLPKALPEWSIGGTPFDPDNMLLGRGRYPYHFDVDLQLKLDPDLWSKIWPPIVSDEGEGPDYSDIVIRPLPPLYPTAEDLDLGPLARSAGSRGVPLTGGWGASAEELYTLRTREMIEAGIDPTIAKMYWQWALEAAMERKMMEEHPTAWDKGVLQEEQAGTAPTILKYDILKLLRKKKK
jgi:outer membrane protein OmpA-like peptidoglycan-associated protein